MKVKSLKRVSTKRTPVYDLTVPSYHNFLLGSEVFVHNSKDEADSFVGSLWLASKSDLGLQYRNSSSDVKSITDSSSGPTSDIEAMESSFLNGKTVVKDLNDLAGRMDDNGIIDIFGGINNDNKK